MGFQRAGELAFVMAGGELGCGKFFGVGRVCGLRQPVLDLTPGHLDERCSPPPLAQR